MRRFVRCAAPDFFLQNAQRWNDQWKKLKLKSPGAAFQWYRYNGHPVNKAIAPVLASQTQGHCSYCDAFPMGLADNTIDHFRPKGSPEFYQLAYSWENLFIACADCQTSKAEKFTHLLLKPDSNDYYFARYFIYNFNTHQIEVHPGAEENDQIRAHHTCNKIFRLNEPNRVDARRMAYERWFSPRTNQEVDDFPFRFIFDLILNLPKNDI